jgi:hypothetical protein
MKIIRICLLLLLSLSLTQCSSVMNADAAKLNVHKGSTPAQVVASIDGWASMDFVPEKSDDQHARFHVNGGKTFSVEFSGGTGKNQTVESKDALGHILDKQVNGDGTAWTLTVVYAGRTPSSFTVVFDPDGKVFSVSPVTKG